MNKISTRIAILKMGETFLDKIRILKWAITRGVLSSEIILNLGDGLKLKCRKGEPNDLWMALDSNEMKFIRNLGNYCTIVDVGANIGRFTLQFSNMSNKVISFEPFKESYNALKDNIEINNLKNVQTLNLACYNSDGVKKMNICDSNCGANSLELETGGSTIEVETIRLDNMNLRPGLIKIDVEGAELKVLQGAINTIKNNNPDILFEALDEECYQGIKLFLDELGYAIHKIGGSDYFAYYCCYYPQLL